MTARPESISSATKKTHRLTRRTTRREPQSISNTRLSERQQKDRRRGGAQVVVVAAAFATLLAASFARAHHSFSVFDMTTTRMLEGEIVEFQWTNPHTWTWLDVTNADGT